MRGASNLLSKYVVSGCHVDLQAVQHSGGTSRTDSQEVKVYHSQVIDVLSDEQVEIAMPVEKSKLIVLPTGREFWLSFYPDNKLYKCRAKVVNRYKADNMHVLVFELVTSLRKQQRREFYRFGCTLEMESRQLLEEEVSLTRRKEEILSTDLPFKKGIIVDISGGGLRFVAKYAYEAQSLILCRCHLTVGKNNKEFNLIGKVLSVKRADDQMNLFEHRVQFVDVNAEEREDIIKYIFDEERKTLKRQMGD